MKQFERVRVTKPQRSRFDLSHEVKLTMNMGTLVPFLCKEVIPGDQFRVTTEMLTRLAPMLSPVMHRVNVYTHYFFVPNRLVWNEWEDFITGGENGLSEATMPVFDWNAWAVGAGGGPQLSDLFNKNGQLWDYMGLPPITSGNDLPQISLLPFRAYQLIYNEYYRDQNLNQKIDILKTSDTTYNEMIELVTTRYRCWEKDYYTSCLPWAQKGLPSELQLPVNYDSAMAYKYPGSVPGDPGAIQVDAQGRITDINGNPIQVNNLDDQQTSITINELRRLEKVQQWLERTARTGSRYIEQILSHFGVVSSDARLQRPEYLGGGKSPIIISEVLSQVQTAEDPQGTMTGHGIGTHANHAFNRTFEEHGFIFGIVSVLPRTAYQQGIDKMFQRTDKFDYFWPEFANLGEQQVNKGELYWDYQDPSGTANTALFGYQERYGEYKYCNSRVAGDFRNNLAFWHMGRIFDSQPELNDAFVTAWDPTNRVFAVTDPNEHKIFMQIYNDIQAIRPIPLFNVPSLGN